MRRLPLVAAMASLLTLSIQTTWAADAAGSLSGQARQTLEAKLIKADPLGVVYINQVFDDITKIDVPTGWRKPTWNKGSVSIDDKNGNLLIDGRIKDAEMTALMLPQSLEALANYRVDMEFTIDAANNVGRWASVMYRTSPEASTIAFDPYHQFAIRQDATAASGVEFALRKGGGWMVIDKKPFSEKIDKARTYQATVIVHGNRVRQYLNGQLVHDAVTAEGMDRGGVGMQTAGTLMRVKSIKVTEQVTALPDLDLPVAVQETGAAVSMAPTLVQSMRTLETASGDGSSNSLYTLDSALNLTGAGGEKLGTLKDLFSQSTRLTVPFVRINDQATVDALVAFSEQTHVLYDITFLSANVDILLSARKQLPSIRTAVDFTSSGLDNSAAAVLKISGDTNRAGAKIAVLPANLLNRTFVAHLQRLLITVWGQSDARTAEQAAQVLTTGVNGVIASDSTVFADVLRKLPANTLLRKPLITGHRGMPEGGKYPENTLESAKAAVAAGADAVENDIYITTDGHLVVMHDPTVDRTTDGTGNIETMTLAQVKALKTKINGVSVPTLREFFREFKGLPITHFTEIKSGTPAVVAKLKQEMAEEGVAEQSVAISFDTAQLKRSTEQVPEMALGFLGGVAGSGNVLNDVRVVLGATQANNSTFNPSYGGLSRATMEAAKHRGTTFWPWTLNTQADFYKFYSWGTHGLTTDYAKWASDFPVEITPAAVPAKLDLNTPVLLDVKLTTQVGNVSTQPATEMVLVGGTAQGQMLKDGSVLFTSAGTAVVMPSYRYAMGDGTYSYSIVSAPVTLAVGDSSVVGAPSSPAAGNVSCSSAVPGQSSVCNVVPQSGYQLVGIAAGSTCPVGSWNAGNNVYTTGVVTGACEVKFDFAALPASASLAAVGKSGAVQATVSGGGTGMWAFDVAQAVSVAPAAQAPEGVSFPFGVTSLQLTGGQPGQAASVELTYPEALPANAKYYKFGATPDNATAHWYVYSAARISGNKVVLPLTDGALGDDDLTANGVIKDPGGVAVVSGTGTSVTGAQPVPTLGHDALALLSAGFGLLAWRRKRPQAAA